LSRPPKPPSSDTRATTPRLPAHLPEVSPAVVRERGDIPKIGLLAQRTLRHRSPSLAVVVAVAAMLAGTVSVAWEMFLPSHDVSAIILVLAIPGAGSLAVTLFLGRQVVAGSKGRRAARICGSTSTARRAGNG
jgi:uncharacterized protein (DUF2062 family)